MNLNPSRQGRLHVWYAVILGVMLFFAHRFPGDVVDVLNAFTSFQMPYPYMRFGWDGSWEDAMKPILDLGVLAIGSLGLLNVNFRYGRSELVVNCQYRLAMIRYRRSAPDELSVEHIMQHAPSPGPETGKRYINE